MIFKAEDPSTGQYKYFVDKCLPFGASISCSLFQKFSNALRHIVTSITGHTFAVTNYLDDFLFTETSARACNRMVRVFLHVCEQINLPVAHDKTEYASSQMVFLGILLDGYHLILAIPLDKKIRAINMLKLIIDKKKATLEELQRLTRYLNFLSKAIFPGHAFTSHMYAKFSGLSNLKKFHHIRLDQEFKLDCRV